MEQLGRRLANALGQSFLSSVGTRPQSVQLPGYCSPATGYFGAEDELRLKTSSTEANYNGYQKNWSWWWSESSTNNPCFTPTTEHFKKMQVWLVHEFNKMFSGKLRDFVPKQLGKTYVENGGLSQGLLTRQLCLVSSWVKLWELCRFLSRIHLKLDGKWVIKVYLVKIQQNNAVKSSEARMLILNSQ